MRPPVVPHNRPAAGQNLRKSESEMPMTEHAVEIAGGGPAGDDAGGGADLGGDRRPHRRATRQRPARKLALQRSALPPDLVCSPPRACHFCLAPLLLPSGT
jgi:hypothetical protein